MTTLGNLIDRIYREWLNPADDYPTFSVLKTAIDASVQTLTYDADTLLLEEEDLLDAGAILELDRELIISGSINQPASELNLLRRGRFGTEAAAHAEGTLIFVNPEVTRQAVYDAVIEEIANLYPPLYRVVSLEAWASTWELPPDVVGGIDSKWHDGSRWQNGGGFDIINADPDSDTGVTAHLRPPYGQRNLLRVKTLFGLPTDEETDLATLGLDSAELQKVVILGAVAAVIAGHDLKASTQEFITEAIERQGYPIGSTERLRNSLLSYRELIVRRIEGHQLSRDGVSVSFADPWPGFQGM